MENPNAKFQQTYFSGDRESPRLRPASTPVIQRHFRESLDGAHLAPGARVLELGAGEGRFTAMLAEAGFDVTAVELSSHLAGKLEDQHRDNPRVNVVNGSALEVDRLVEPGFDFAIGYFFLHHIVDFDGLFGAAARCLRPGAELRFCEPNAWNPLYYVQVAITPGMRFSGEPSLRHMRLGALQEPLAAAGFQSIRSTTYGFFPPFLSNRKWGAGIEGWLERIHGLAPVRAYRMIMATAAGSGAN